MALIDFGNMSLQARGFGNLPVLRQLGMLVGLSISIALGVGIVLWAQEPDYRVLYNNLDAKDAGEIGDALQAANIKYKISEATGGVLVSANDIYNARLTLATQGLPKGVGSGYELLEQNSTFGVSQFMENVRYQRALEGELSRTISSINSVRSARVHLAIPKKSAFMREKKEATASVTLDMYPGRSLESEQITAISYLVAGSIPDLEENNVIVIDQKGRLLKASGDAGDIQHSTSQFEYKKELEQYYIKRIENILTPVVGQNAVRAQVAADIDFTVTEQTQESYNPDMPAIRSEQTVEEKSGARLENGGVPGSQANQPQSGSPSAENESARQALPGNSLRRSTRNYELDKTISHTRAGGNSIKRLSVAVVVDDEKKAGTNGNVERVPLSSEKLQHITDLVKDAIGFDAQRGDSVNVINTTFSEPPPPAPLPEPGILENPETIRIAKQLGAAGMVVFIVLGLLRPIMRELASKGKQAYLQAGPAQGVRPQHSDEQAGLEQSVHSRMGTYEENIGSAKSIVNQDPKRVAQVVNSWVATDA